MATSSNYYIDTATFATATAVFMNQGLSVLAPDGIYSFGSTTRQQSGGVLLAAVACPACGTPCGTSIGGSGSQGVYKINLDVGSLGTGAIRIRFNPASFPDGIRATYNGVVYNKLSSPNFGALQSPNAGHFTIIGSVGGTSTCTSWYPSGETQTNTVFLYNSSTSLFDNTGTTQVDTISPAPNADFFVLSGSMGDCWMVIPKTSNTPSTVLIEIIGPCTGTGWTFAAFCPVALPTFFASSVQPTSSVPCTTTINLGTPLYFAKVHTAADTFVGLYDYVFIDANGQFPLANGYYLISNVAAPNKVIQVANGVVIAITDCI